jgi:hypothetical protein
MPIIALRPFVAGGKNHKPGDPVKRPEGPREFRIYRALYEMFKIKNVDISELRNEIEGADNLDKITSIKELRELCVKWDVKPHTSKDITRERIRQAMKVAAKS